MSTKNVQQLSLDFAKAFDRVRYKFVEAKPGEVIDFKFNYSGDTPILGIKKSCGCVANIKVNPDSIEGTYNVGTNFKGSQNAVVDVQQSFTVYFDDGEPFSTVVDGVVVNNPNKPKVILTLDGQVHLEQPQEANETVSS